MKDVLNTMEGKQVTFYTRNFIYHGTVVQSHENAVELKDAGIVYETGAHDTKEYSDIQALPKNWFVAYSAIESYGEFK